MPAANGDGRPAGGPAEYAGRPGLISWAMYDWANSAFITVIQTFIFAAYFTQRIAVDETTGSNLWGNAIGVAGLLVAFGGPVLGAIADQSGRRKPWLLFFTTLCILCTALLWFMKPDSSFTVPALLLVGAAIICFEFASIFYNAMLPDLSPEDHLGRWSGWGWGLGYAGGLLCLVAALVLFMDGENTWIDLNRETSADVRATFLLVAGWYLFFSLPLFLITPDRKQIAMSRRTALKKGLRQLYQTIREVRRYGNIFRFLIARMIFVDGLATVFAFGGIYAATVFGMDEKDVLLFGIGLNVSAGMGAALFAFIDDRVGARKTILISLGGLVLTSLLILTVSQTLLFWVFSLILGIFVGPCQASSRSYLARMAPAHLRSEMFGLLALSGKATAFMGPVLVGWLTYLSGSQRLGMSVIVFFFISGFFLMLPVADDHRQPAGKTGEGKALP
ncbi:MAG: MFS transporter [Desulfurivibrionaceae bacterium]|nr:MFS transporter [Desulfurivibrionaceae bacterium]